MLFFLYPNQIHVDRGVNEAPFAINSTTPTERRRYPRTILSLCILHTCIWVLPIIAISIPRPRMELTVYPNTLFIGLCDFLLLPACIVLVTCMFPLQIREIISLKRPIHESSLSPTTLALQMIAFILLGLSWKNRLGRPGDPFNITPPDLTLPWALYVVTCIVTQATDRPVTANQEGKVSRNYMMCSIVLYALFDRV